MTLNPYIVLGSAVVGLLGRADRGRRRRPDDADADPAVRGEPSAAISSDLVAAVLMRPVGAAVHLRKGTVNLRLVGWMVVGSVPMAFVGAYLLHLLGGSSCAAEARRGRPGHCAARSAAAMVFRVILDRRSATERTGTVHKINVLPGADHPDRHDRWRDRGPDLGGSGYDMGAAVPLPLFSAGQVVGTDLTQAVPLTAAAALGALIFGTVQFGVTGVARGRQRAGCAHGLRPLRRGHRTTTSGPSSPS